MDLLQFLIDGAEGVEARTDHLVLRAQLLNFASIHTTTSVYLFYLACLTKELRTCFV